MDVHLTAYQREIIQRWWWHTIGSKRKGFTDVMKGERKFATCHGSYVSNNNECTKWLTEKVRNRIDFRQAKGGSYTCKSCRYYVEREHCRALKAVKFEYCSQTVTVMHQGDTSANRNQITTFVVLPNSLKCLKKRGKGLLNKAESMKEFATQTRIKYATCMDLLLEGDRLKPGEIINLCCSDDYEAITDFGSMSDKEKDEHIYALYGRVSKYKSDEYMCKWLSFFIIMHKQTLQAKAGRYLKLKKLKLDTWAEGVKLGRRADILSVCALSTLISKHTLIHLRNGNIWTTMETSNMDHDDLMKDCNVHLAYLGNGLLSEVK